MTYKYRSNTREYWVSVSIIDGVTPTFRDYILMCRRSPIYGVKYKDNRVRVSNRTLKSRLIQVMYL